MSFAEEWKQLPGQSKMFIIGGGGLALFFLFSAIKNKNSRTTSQQDTSTGPQTAAIDPTSWIDNQNQQMQAMQQLIGGISDSMNQYQQSNQQSNQDNLQSMQQLIQQNQQATQQQIQALNNLMAQPPSYNPVPSTPVSALPQPVTSSPAKVTGTIAPQTYYNNGQNPNLGTMTTGTYNSASAAAKVADTLKQQFGPNVRIVGTATTGYRVQADMPTQAGADSLAAYVKKQGLASVAYGTKIG